MLGRRIRRRSKAAALAVAMLAAGVTLTAPPAAAQSPWSVTSPTTSLGAVAELTAVWNGGEVAQYYYFQQCLAGELSVERCQTLYFAASLEGGPEVSFSVARFLQTSTDVVDCAVVDCVLRVTAGYTGAVALVEPLDFVATTERPLPTVQLTPAAGLAHGAGVTVEVDIPAGYRYPTLLQCHRDDLALDACHQLLTPEADSESYLRWRSAQAVRSVQARQIRQAFQSSDGDLIGCGVDECVLVIASAHERLALTPLIFDSPPAFELAVTMEVSPNSGLVDGQVIDVAVTAPAGTYRVEQCVLGPQPYCQNRLHTIQPPPIGAAHLSVEVDRIVRDHFVPVDQSAVPDCAEAECILRIWPSVWGAVAPAAVVPLTFDPEAPFRLAPKLSISPDGPVYDGQTVTVNGSGYAPNAATAVGLCPGPNPSGLKVFDVWAAAQVCGVLGFVTTDASGEFSTTVELYTQGRGALGSDAFDCTLQPCWVGASTFSLRGGFTPDLVFVSEELATTDPRIRDLLLDVTTSNVLDEIHMADEKTPEPPPTPAERLDALDPQAVVEPERLGKTTSGDG